MAKDKMKTKEETVTKPTDSAPKTNEQIGQEQATASMNAVLRTVKLIKNMSPEEMKALRETAKLGCINGLFSAIESMTDPKEKAEAYERILDKLLGAPFPTNG